jgi:hypothetical protein
MRGFGHVRAESNPKDRLLPNNLRGRWPIDVRRGMDPTVSSFSPWLDLLAGAEVPRS